MRYGVQKSVLDGNTFGITWSIPYAGWGGGGGSMVALDEKCPCQIKLGIT